MVTDNLIGRINEALVGTTPGPWHWKKDFTAPGDDGTGLALTDESATVEIIGAYNFHCCSFRDDPTVGSDADARLIAAAPALLREAAEQLAAKDAEIERLRGLVPPPYVWLGAS